MDRLVSTLWDRIFPGQLFGPDHRLDQVFSRTLHQSELLTQNICPYYFDQVAWSLPAASLRLVLLKDVLMIRRLSSS